MSSTSQHYDWRRAAAHVLEMAQTIEVAAVDPATVDDLGPVGRTSLLELRDRCLIIELPTHRETVQSIRQTHHVALLLVDQGVRLQCVSRVDEVIKYRLNEQTEVWALRLSEPMHVQSMQRRSFFRAMTAHLKLQVTMQPLAETPLHTGVEIPDGSPFKAILVNISGGGVGVIAPQRAGQVVHQYARYRCTIALPSHDEPLSVAARHVHLHRNPDDTSFMGMEFDFASAAEQRRIEDDICRFTTWLQRQELARQR